MDHIKILKRSFSITRDYRALWVFGILLALTTGGRGSGGSNGGGGDGGGGGGVPSGGWPEISPEVLSALIAAGIALLIVALILFVASVILRYVSETALIRMVDGHEASNEKLGVRQGFRLGWSRPALRLFLMDLLIALIGAAIFLLLFLIAATPLLVWLTDSTPARVFGTMLTVGLALLVIFFAIAVGIALSLLVQFFRRAIVLENMGVIDGMRRGWQIVRQRLGDVILMGLILFGLGLAWVIVKIPIIIALVMAALVVGGLPALFAGMIAGLFTEGAVPWIVAAVVGLPISFIVIGVPMLFLSGLVETYQSTTWTLTYRELLALEAARPSPAGNNNLPPELPAQA
jgi:hypothetical protein